MNLHHELFHQHIAAPWNPPGQWWERCGQVVFLHPAMDPNDNPFFNGWVKVTETQARAVLDAQPKEQP